VKEALIAEDQDQHLEENTGVQIVMNIHRLEVVDMIGGGVEADIALENTDLLVKEKGRLIEVEHVAQTEPDRKISLLILIFGQVRKKQDEKVPLMRIRIKVPAQLIVLVLMDEIKKTTIRIIILMIITTTMP